jgi:hypothetical protein
MIPEDLDPGYVPIIGPPEPHLLRWLRRAYRYLPRTATVYVYGLGRLELRSYLRSQALGIRHQQPVRRWAAHQVAAALGWERQLAACLRKECLTSGNRPAGSEVSNVQR